MRLNAEKERICHYREIARRSAIKYYKVLKEIIKYNLIHVMGSKTTPEKKPPTTLNREGTRSLQPNFYQQKETKINCIYYLTDYLKLVIENGKEFEAQHLYSILDSFIVEELSDEVIEAIKILLKEFEFDKREILSWIETCNPLKRKQNKLKEML